MKYLNAIHQFFITVDVGSEVEAGGYAILEKHHPNFLPVCVVHGGVKGDKLEIRLKGLQFLVKAGVEHTHVVISHV